jgi:lipopolysaccharide/colanic/teichoic acid biosynthesis glycosyltransferase
MPETATRNHTPSLFARIIKRAVDVVAAASLGLILAPLLVYLYVRVRKNLGSPAFFKQTRIGKNEQPFTMIKFRTMRDGEGSDAERLTPFGVWLRKTSMDELPELWNILKGEMSLVGPRPLLPVDLPYYTPKERLRHRVPPGITGLAQVRGRNAIDWDTRLAYDVTYVEQYSLWLDIRILWETVGVVLHPTDVSTEGHATSPRLGDVRARQPDYE